MKKILFLVLILSNLLIYSQEKNTKLKIGVCKSWFNYEDDFFSDMDTEFAPTLDVSIHQIILRTDSFNYSVGLRYSRSLRSVNIDYMEQKMTSDISHHLISFPLQMNYETGFLNTNLILNLEPSYLVRSDIDYIYINQDLLLQKKNEEVTSEMNRLNLAIGIGLEYKLPIAGYDIIISTLYNYGLFDVPEDEEQSVSPNAVRQWAEYSISKLNLTLGYRF